MAQRHSAAVAFDYVAGLSPGTKANCWSIAESARHEGWGPNVAASALTVAFKGARSDLYDRRLGSD
jgi:hypothetical protein